MQDINLFSAKKGLSILTFGVLLVSFLSIADVHATTTTLRPNADGYTLDYTPLSGTLHYAMVNDTSPNEDTNYVYVGSQNQDDSWGIEDSTYEAGTINSVTVYMRVKHDIGGEAFLIKVYTYSTAYASGSISDSTSYTDYNYAWTTNPNTLAAWTWTEIDALEIGIRSDNIAGWGGEQRVTQAWAVVDYTPSWTWDSYTNSACTLQSDSFTSGNTVWVCGIDFKPNADYDVAVYDGADVRQCYANPATANATGGLKVSCVTSGGNANWKSQVFTVNGASVTYDGSDPDELAEDLSACTGACAFAVTGVLEFGYILIPLIMSGMIYLWIRRRFSGHLTGLT